MKKTILLFGLSLFSIVFANAQNVAKRTFNLTPEPLKSYSDFTNFENINYTNTLLSLASCIREEPPSAYMTCGSQLVIINLGGSSGYITGNNYRGDLEKAQRYMGVGGTNKVVDTVFVLVVNKNGTTGNTYVKLYSVDPTTKAPQTLLGTSNPVSMSNISSSLTANPQYYIFNPPVSVPSDFFASFVLPTVSQEVAVVASTQNNCWSGDSLTYELHADNTWHSMYSAWVNQGDHLKIEMFIVPVVCTSDDINNITFQNDVSIYPNPVINSFTIDFLGNKQKDATANVYNMVGKLVKTVSVNDFTDKIVIDMTSESESFYILNIKTTSGTILKKLSLMK